MVQCGRWGAGIAPNPLHAGVVGGTGAAGAAEAEGRTATTITFSCTGTGLSYSLVSGPSQGTLGPISGGQVTYTPNAGFSGPDSVQVTATNVAGQTATDTVTVTVAAAPGPPTAIDHHPSGAPNSRIQVRTTPPPLNVGHCPGARNTSTHGTPLSAQTIVGPLF
jgi:hypothetical protein